MGGCSITFPPHASQPDFNQLPDFGGWKGRNGTVGRSRGLVLSSTSWGQAGRERRPLGTWDTRFAFADQIKCWKAGELAVFAEQTLPGGDRQRKSV